MKKPWDPHTIRMVEWFGPIPKPGDTLFNSRRAYQVLEIKKLERIGTFHRFQARCIVLPADATPLGTAYAFRSMPRSALRMKRR